MGEGRVLQFSYKRPCSLYLEGRRHDTGMLADSGLLQNLQQFAFSPTGQAMCIYGDPAYPLRIHLQAPFRNHALTPQMQAYNAVMSGVRTSVEWLFGDIINYFKFLDFKKNLKIQLSSVGKMYVVLFCVMHSLVFMETRHQSSSKWSHQHCKNILFRNINLWCQ